MGKSTRSGRNSETKCLAITSRSSVVCESSTHCSPNRSWIRTRAHLAISTRPLEPSNSTTHVKSIGRTRERMPWAEEYAFRCIRSTVWHACASHPAATRATDRQVWRASPIVCGTFYFERNIRGQLQVKPHHRHSTSLSGTCVQEFQQLMMYSSRTPSTTYIPRRRSFRYCNDDPRYYIAGDLSLVDHYHHWIAPMKQTSPSSISEDDEP